MHRLPDKCSIMIVFDGWTEGIIEHYILMSAAYAAMVDIEVATQNVLWLYYLMKTSW